MGYDTDVVVIGAGVAGLSAARQLSEAGVGIAIIEARDRIGGRICTVRDDDVTVPIELGAEFIHGRATELYALLAEAGLEALDVGGSRWRSSGGRLHGAEDFWTRIERVMRRLDDGSQDRSLDDALRSLAGGRTLAADRRLTRQFVEGFHAADPARISAKVLAQGGSPGGDVREQRLGRVAGGYDLVAAWLASPVAEWLHLSAIVTEVQWEAGAVTVTIRNASGSLRQLSARAAIVSVPLGVLQAPPRRKGAIAFSPALTAKASALERLGVGLAIRVALELDERFWASEWFAARQRSHEIDTMSFLHADAGDFQAYWTLYPTMAPVMVAWCGGLPAQALGEKPRNEIVSAAMAALARQTGLSTRRMHAMVTAAWMHNWAQDPFARGAYSYQLVGGEDAPAVLARPLLGTLFFAGEATDTEGATGTVHGALATGRRAARQVMRALRRAA